jgi:tyrosyl-DNA phosphodiesterase-1
VHKAMRYLVDQHPAGSSIPFDTTNGFARMAKWDWSRVTVKLVMSVPGAYKGTDEMDQFGVCRLGSVISSQGWKAGKGERAVVEYQVGQVRVWS